MALSSSQKQQQQQQQQQPLRKQMKNTGGLLTNYFQPNASQMQWSSGGPLQPTQPSSRKSISSSQDTKPFLKSNSKPTARLVKPPNEKLAPRMAPSDQDIITISDTSVGSVIVISSSEASPTPYGSAKPALQNRVGASRARQPQSATSTSASLRSLERTSPNKSNKRARLSSSSASSIVSLSQTMTKKPKASSSRRPKTPIVISDSEDDAPSLPPRKPRSRAKSGSVTTLNSPSSTRLASVATVETPYPALPTAVKQESQVPHSRAHSSSSNVAMSASSPCSKRSAIASPPGSPAPSPKRARVDPPITSATQASPAKPKYILDGDIIPSSEGDDEVDLMPIERPLSACTEAEVVALLVNQEDVGMTIETGGADEGGLHFSKSEVEVDVSLRTADLLPPEPIGQETDYDGADEEVQEEVSDAESDDSARALKRARAADISGALEDDDDDLFDMSFSNMNRRSSSSFKGISSGSEEERHAAPHTPSHHRSGTISSVKHVKRVYDSLITSSPLTPTSSPHKRARADGDDDSPRPASRCARPTKRNATTKMKAESSEDSDAALPLPKPKVDLAHLKPSKSTALDGLLKEKKSRHKKYGALLSPGTVIGAIVVFSSPTRTLTNVGVDESPTTARRFLTPIAEASLDGVLDKPAKIKDILARDLQFEAAEERRCLEAEQVTRNTFWKEISATGPGELVAKVVGFPVVDCQTPILKRLQKAAMHEDLDLIVVFLRSGSLCLEDALPDDVFDWLLNLAVLHSDSGVSTAAFTCLNDLLSNPSDAVKEVELDFATIRRLLMGLGMKEDASQLLSDEDTANGEEVPSYPPPSSEDKRLEQLGRLLGVIQLFAQPGQVYLQDVPRIVLALLLISHDPSSSTQIKTEITKALGVTLRNIDRAKPKRGIQLELDSCMDIVSSLEERTVADALEISRVMPSSDARTIRMSRWIALGALGGSSVVDDLNHEQYLLPPSLTYLSKMVFGMEGKEKGKTLPSVATSAVKFVVDKATDYEEMTMNVDLLGRVLMGVDVFISAEPQTAMENLDKLAQGLVSLMGRIQDNRGAQLERTRAKDELHRLRVRLSYSLTSRPGGQNSLMGAIGMKRAPIQRGLKDFFAKTQVETLNVGGSQD
ncbi:hypothetical protein FRB93_007580 [Tulasnella sp. JGI-2019a]|nr:hypothetical protein FRB93_007580 [Tulasnella sp. JGI-2019a]